MKDKIRIASGQGFWGDLIDAPYHQVTKGEIDYLVMDYLAEVTMSILQKQKNKNPDFGYARDIPDLMKRILPAIKEKKIVLCDRFNDSSIAYQGEARGLGIDNVISFSSYILEDAIPDLTIYLDIDPKIAMQRIKRGLDKIEEEKIIFHEKIRRGFKILQKKDPSRIKMIDASRSPKKVFDSAIIFIDYLLK